MIATRQALIQALTEYVTPYPEEEKFATTFLDLLAYPRCFHRDHLPGHITGSAWILDSRKEQVLLTHHAKLNRWLQPGGHADGDENVFHVALREAREETGLKNIMPLSESLFDIDIHPIPALKEFPEHFHYDLRFCFLADPMEPLVITHESHDLRWVPLNSLHDYTDSSSILRMKKKAAT